MTYFYSINNLVDKIYFAKIRNKTKKVAGRVKKMRKKWTKKDLRRLTIAYEMGASYRLLCQILDKTATSINKQLTRAGIRPLGSSKRGKRQTDSLVSAEDIWNEINYQEQINPLEEEIKTKESFRKPIFLKATKRTRLTPENEVEYCDTLQPPISYLLSLGYQVKKIYLTWADYVINSKPLTSSQLIIFTNRLRCETGLKPFVVSGYVY
jgi:hypothetical protein